MIDYSLLLYYITKNNGETRSLPIGRRDDDEICVTVVAYIAIVLLFSIYLLLVFFT
jgi:hypothetical protein